jgi:hypothetical protein
MISDSRIEGLIGHFSKLFRLAADNLVKIRVSSFFGNGLPKHIVELTTGLVFESRLAPSQWLSCEFLNHRDEPQRYSALRAPIGILTFTEPNRMNPGAFVSSSNVLSFCLNILFHSHHPFLKNPD